ncbi:MAG: aldehyde dehydrogenase family protein [Zetaproteobacteria bacterium]|nr:aldehyde dehydrogenase family protein [Zetaproteobacteria bacterium]
MKTWQDWLDSKGLMCGASNGVKWLTTTGSALVSYSPIDSAPLAKVQAATDATYQQIIEQATVAAQFWRGVPAPQRGEFIRIYGDLLRASKKELGCLVSVEMGKSLTEGEGEVQEMIDICDYAVGLSRSMCGRTLFSERVDHRMYEQWHPLGVVGIITAFNFPVAVWAWNFTIATVCGNATVWKPSEKTPLTAIACFKILHEAAQQAAVPAGVCNLTVDADALLGKTMAVDPRVQLVSATGSSRMGQSVAMAVSQRFGKVLLELGGNNAVILTKTAPLDLAIPAIVFGAVGTAGQRCTSTRRVIVHRDLLEQVTLSLQKAFTTLKIGSPLERENHLGPLIDQAAVDAMMQALDAVRLQGGQLLSGGQVLHGKGQENGLYVQPALVAATESMEIVGEETFAPILYLLSYNGELQDAIRIQNQVKQGLSSSIFTLDLREAEQFLSAVGSDCGIANVNIGTSGAEIGGAFGGEKETGGGRESGSDAWKAYMRRQTNTINYSTHLPLAQGVEFSI